MARRKKKLLLSDLFPELAAEREVAEEEEREREEEEPARKVRKVNARGADRSGYLSKMEEKYDARLEVCKQWKQTKGRFPKANKKDKEENNLYKWLRNCGPGGTMWTQARWEKLNEAFGEGWEKECFPYLETGGWVGQAGSQFRRERDEAQWDAILDAVVKFWEIHRRFPEWSDGGDARRLYMWLRDNMDTTSHIYTHGRANKLDEALNPLSVTGDWRMDAFPTRFEAEIRALVAAAELARQHPESSRRGAAIPNRLATANNLMARQNLLRTIHREDTETTETTETTNPTMI